MSRNYLRRSSRRIGAGIKGVRRYWRPRSILHCCLMGLRRSASRALRSTSPTAISSPPRRAFIVADTPGHEQYTRNMASGASNCEVAVLLVDARRGLLRQTRRHAIIVSLLGIRHAVLAINKWTWLITLAKRLRRRSRYGSSPIAHDTLMLPARHTSNRFERMSKGCFLRGLPTRGRLAGVRVRADGQAKGSSGSVA